MQVILLADALHTNTSYSIVYIIFYAVYLYSYISDDSAYFNFRKVISWVIGRHHAIKFSRRTCYETWKWKLQVITSNKTILVHVCENRGLYFNFSAVET